MIGVILGAVSIGLGSEWSRLETVRLNEGVPDGSTVKNIGLLSRCVDYTITTEIQELGLSLDQQPLVSKYHINVEPSLVIVGIFKQSL